MENEINNKKPCTHNFIRNLLRGIGFFIIVSGIIIIVLGSTFLWLKYRGIQERKQVEYFLHQVVDSICNNSDYYKEHSTQRALKELKEIENSPEKMSGNYDIIYIDCYLGGTYDYRILFENNIAFRVEVFFEKGKPLLCRFGLEPPLWTQRYLMSIRGAATKNSNDYKSEDGNETHKKNP